MIEEIKNILETRINRNQVLKGMFYRSERRIGSFEDMGENTAQGIPILGRAKNSKSDPNVKTASDFINIIGGDKAGYLTHNIQRVYNDDAQDDLKEKYKEFDRINNQDTISSEVMFDNATMGVGYTLLYVEDGTVKKKKINAWQAFVVYENNIPKYGVICNDKNTRLEKSIIVKEVYIYTDNERLLYEHRTYDSNISDRWILKQKVFHGFNGIPVTEWRNNARVLGNAEKAITYIDAYDRVLSDSATEQSASRQAYLMLKNAGVIDDDFMEKLRKFGVITIDQDGGDSKWLEKNLNSDFARLILEELEKNIYRNARIVDEAKLISLSDPRKNQIDMIYRGMDNDCDMTEKQWKMAFEYEDKLLMSYWTTMAIPSISDYNTYDIDYIFIRNKPKDPVADLEAYKRAGVELPNWHKLILLGYKEDEARALSEEAIEEILGSMDIDDTAEEEV